MDIQINQHEIVLEYLKRIQGQPISITHVHEIEALLANADGEIKPKNAQSRLIIFLESTKFNYHEGYVFNQLEDARTFLFEEMNEGFFQSAKVGVFVDHADSQEQTKIQSVDFLKKKEHKKAEQLKIFK